MYLNTHSYYSLRYGTLSPKQLVEAAKERGISCLALTDINNTSVSFEFVQHCQAAGIKPVVGVEFRKHHRLLYIALARNAEGFRRLCRLLSDHSLDGIDLPDLPPAMDDVFFILPKLIKPIERFRENEFLGVRPEHVNLLFQSEVRKYPEKLVAWRPVTFLDATGHSTHQLLRAIDLNVVLSKLGPRDQAKANELLESPEGVEKYYAPYPELIQNAYALLEQCSIQFDQGMHLNRQTFTGNKKDDMKLLTKLSVNGCKRRYGANNKKAIVRLKKELKVIDQLKFVPYFLITWDIVRYAQTTGYHYVGRGSGANSIVAYCLDITNVDPLELDLYFERFINPHRSSPPDFDVDFSWDERDDVIDYIFKRYGRDYTAMLATYNTFKFRSVVRELGKVFGVPKHEIDLIVNEPTAHDRHHDLADTIIAYGHRIEGFPNYLSIHAGGILITEKPIHYYTALQMMPKGFPITHFDMYGAEDRGLHKYDVLSQRGLGHLKDAVELVHLNQGKRVDIFEVERIKKDPKVRAQLKSGKCIGCFYIESPAMRGLLSKLRCDNYVSLVAASSIIRPGVAQSGMMREYIHRFHHPNSFDYIHPVFEEQLAETYGVMVYQEDVMKIVHHFAGLDLDESDVLRRIMTGKKKKSDTFRRLKHKYFENCRTRGHSDEMANEVWRQIESFGGYSFCKAHSASFAVESFQSLFLKTYHPLEFMVAVINNFGGFYRTEYYFHEARMQGANIHAPCVNKSVDLTTIYGEDVYIGFIHIQGLERKVVRQIVEQRKLRGVFKGLEDFVSRVKLGAEQLEILIRIGAFRFTGMNKYELMWEKNAVFNPASRFHGTPGLFSSTKQPFRLPDLSEGQFDQAFDEMELLGFPLCSPFRLLADDPKSEVQAADLQKYMGRRITMLGYYVVRKDVRTVNGKRMNFGTWLDRSGDYFDTTHFPPSLKRSPFRGKGVYRIYGQVVEDFGFASLEVLRMERLPFRKDEREAE
ncbi:MAG: DNA polymerase III subunit alpha [Bacteroidota bacterium]